MALIEIKRTDKLVLGKYVYKTANDAYNHTNRQNLISKYRGTTVSITQLYKFKGVNCVAYVKPIGFFAASQVNIVPAQPIVPLPAGHATKNFKYSEFACKCNGKYCNGRNGIALATWEGRARELAEVLEKIRAEVNRQYPLSNGKERPLYVMSGTRCARLNASVGGAGSSYHMSGKAADISVPGINSGAICRKINVNGGVGTGGGHYPHVDIRGYPERWTY